jgi:quinolinate synthase
VEATKRLEKLKAERNAIVLAHNSQMPEVQEAADLVGDSLELALGASKSKAQVLVFCGVHFMAETAAILSPGKTVLMPDHNAGCRMVRMLSLGAVRQMRARHPGAVVVTHVSSSAALQAESDICCTYDNAVEVVRSIPADKPVIFIPDKFLGDYVAEELKRPLILSKSYCPIQQRILPEHIDRARAEHPEAKVVVQPDSSAEVRAKADEVCAMPRLADYCRRSDATEFVIGAENGLIYRLSREMPDKKFFAASPVADCKNMRLTTVEKIIWSLEDMQYIVAVEPEVADRARRAIRRMLEITSNKQV